ncbi:MAG: hypothetical protein H0T88_01165 [Lysobacter sp.]|nr:hypothetical protein [Lysobacter sp.]
MTDLRNSLALGLLLSITTTAVLAQERPKNIENFQSTAGWTVTASDQVSGALRETEGFEQRTTTRTKQTPKAQGTAMVHSGFTGSSLQNW